jgi:hypothetical protein
MKTKHLCSAALIALTTVVSTAAPEFAGYAEARNGARFVLSEGELSRASDWLALGDSFRDYKLIAFDRPNEVLTVERDGKRFELRLKVSRVKDDKAGMNELAAKLTAARADLAKLRMRYRESHPTIIAARKQISELEAQVP